MKEIDLLHPNSVSSPYYLRFSFVSTPMDIGLVSRQGKESYLVDSEFQKWELSFQPSLAVGVC